LSFDFLLVLLSVVCELLLCAHECVTLANTIIQYKIQYKICKAPCCRGFRGKATVVSVVNKIDNWWVLLATQMTHHGEMSKSRVWHKVSQSSKYPYFWRYPNCLKTGKTDERKPPCHKPAWLVQPFWLVTDIDMQTQTTGNNQYRIIIEPSE